MGVLAGGGSEQVAKGGGGAEDEASVERRGGRGEVVWKIEAAEVAEGGCWTGW